MSSLKEIKELQDHLIKCTCKKVMILHELVNFEEIFNCSPAVLITPGAAKRIDGKRYSSCGGIFRFEFMITLAYYCPTPTHGGVVERHDCEDPYCGPIIEADEHLCEVITCIEEFNCKKDEGNKGLFQTYNLTEYMKPIYRDGCVLLRTMWEKDINICF